jgi:hypothetical protein
MTTEEIEDVVRALIKMEKNIEASAAKQSMREAFVQVCAYASATRASARRDRPGNDRPELDRSVQNSTDA